MAERLLRLGRNLVLFAGIGLWLATAPLRAAPSATLIMDARTGEVIFAQNADTRLHPASLTKMMTLYIAFQEIEAGRLSLDGLVTISKHAAAQPPSRLGLRPGQKIALRYLIRAAAIKSANDAATAIGELIGGSEAAFAQRMTATANALGMKNTTFRNANGLTAQGHLSTARDMSILGRHLFYDFPQYYGLFSQRSSDAGVTTVHNSNTRFLDAYPGADGIKTGFTAAAGFNLTASAKRGGKRLIVTVFGAPSTAARNARVAELLDKGFAQVAENVRVRKPNPAPLLGSGPVAVASAEETGGAGKTVRVSGRVERSPNPPARPAWLGKGPDATALAIAADVANSLGEGASAPPEPAEVATDGDSPAPAPAPQIAAGTAPPPAPEDLAPAATVVAADPSGPPADTPPPGTLDAQALALADAATPDSSASEPDPSDARAQPVPGAAAAPALALGPPPRPEGASAATEPAAAPGETPAGPDAQPAGPSDESIPERLASPAPASPADPAPGEVIAAVAKPSGDTPSDEADLSGIETVASSVSPRGKEVEEPAASRRAPIFETVTLADAAPENAEEEAQVVVSKSTSGGQDWGAHVGTFASRGDAERALVSVGLAESATLEGGLRKVTHVSSGYRASFLGLSHDKAELACRRIRARGMDCEAAGPT